MWNCPFAMENFENHCMSPMANITNHTYKIKYFNDEKLKKNEKVICLISC